MRKSLNTKINKVILFLTYADILTLSSWGLITPFLAIYLTDNIKDGSLALVGISTTIYFIVKSIFQIPIARFIDKRKGEKDDFYLLLIGYSLLAITALGFVFAEYSWQIYLLQILNGLATAISFAPWTGIFTRHIDKNAEAFEWSFYDTTISLTTALSASVGGLLINSFGFENTFLIVFTISVLSIFFVIGIRDSLYKTRSKY